MTRSPLLSTLSPAATAIRQAVADVFAASPAPPTTENVAAAVLRAAADSVHHNWDGCECVDHLMALAAELEGSSG